MRWPSFGLVVVALTGMGFAALVGELDNVAAKQVSSAGGESASQPAEKTTAGIRPWLAAMGKLPEKKTR